MSSDRPRVLSGIQPTADSLHLGNYLGALRQWVALQDTHDTFYFVADLHAFDELPEPAALRARTRRTAAQFLAAGVDPRRATVFVQSHLPQHTQLTWLLSCLTGYGEASRMTQFKDKAARQGTAGANVGLFTYPILQAADILLYQADLVPVGEDQRQHLELSRDLAQRFNSRFGETFVVPEPYILKATAKVYDLQVVEKQMSKTIGGSGVVWLLDDPKTIEKKIRTAVTDTGREVTFDPAGKPGVSNLLTILSAFSGEPVPALVERFEGRGYGDLKKEAGAALLEWVVPFQQRIEELLESPQLLDSILAEGAARAEKVAQSTLAQAYEAAGLLAGRG